MKRKYFYKWSADGTVLYVKRLVNIPPGRFRPARSYEEEVYTLYTRNFDDVVAEAERMIKIYEQNEKNLNFY